MAPAGLDYSRCVELVRTKLLDHALILRANAEARQSKSTFVYLQREVVLSCVGVRQARTPLPSRDGEGVSVVSRCVRREVLLQIRDHLVDGHAVRVQEGVVVAPARTHVCMKDVG